MGLMIANSAKPNEVANPIMPNIPKIGTLVNI